MSRRRITSTDGNAGIVRQNLGQFFPAVFRLELEHLEVDGRYAGRVFFEQFVHSFGEFLLVQRFRQFIDNAVAVMGMPRVFRNVISMSWCLRNSQT